LGEEAEHLFRNERLLGRTLSSQNVEACLRVGQCDGFIRLSSQRQVYFHRADLRDDTPFNALSVGDAVKFDLIEDAVSGARAIRVTRKMRAAKAASR